jgi:hypothetical protein
MDNRHPELEALVEAGQLKSFTFDENEPDEELILEFPNGDKMTIQSRQSSHDDHCTSYLLVDVAVL